jgi:hypothetical protein
LQPLPGRHASNGIRSTRAFLAAVAFQVEDHRSQVFEPIPTLQVQEQGALVSPVYGAISFAVGELGHSVHRAVVGDETEREQGRHANLSDAIFKRLHQAWNGGRVLN